MCDVKRTRGKIKALILWMVVYINAGCDHCQTISWFTTLQHFSSARIFFSNIKPEFIEKKTKKEITNLESFRFLICQFFYLLKRIKIWFSLKFIYSRSKANNSSPNGQWQLWIIVFSFIKKNLLKNLFFSKLSTFQK